MALSHPLKRKTLLCLLKPFIPLQMFKSSFVEAGGAQFSSDTGACSASGEAEFSKWRKLDSRKYGIGMSKISVPARIVVKTLQTAGFEAYLVGGCVRDLLLNKVPKDFDVITSASLSQVKRKFKRAMIVGQRFPICMVIIKGSRVEVSSFDTVAQTSRKKKVGISKLPKGCDPKDLVRWKNSMSRDFTVNSLYFDPFKNVVFDYTDAITDLKSLKLRTITPAHLSFKEDEARILRGLRLAARLSLSFSKETEAALHCLRLSVANISTSRISLEMNYMLSYGAAEPSLILLKRFKLLEILLPFHAAYLSDQVDNRLGIRSLMLMKLFFYMDQLVTCDRPCNDSLWVAILAFHLALFSNPQHPFVVLTFGSLLYHRTWEDSIMIARQSALATQIYVPEILDSFDYLSDDDIAERVTQFAAQVKTSIRVLINSDYLFEAMDRFPKSPNSGLVFISKKRGEHVNQIFNILAKDVKFLKVGKRSTDIDCKLLAAGDTTEVRFVLGKIILDTLLCPSSERRVSKDNKDSNQGQKIEKAPQQILHTLMHLEKPESIVEEKKKKNTLPSDDKLSGKVKHERENSDLDSQSSVPKKILKNEHVNNEIPSKKASPLSSLFK